MAAGNKFNNFAAAMPNGQLNLSGDTFKVMLTNTLPVATNSVYADVSAGEIGAGTGYTTGGATLTLVSSTQSSGTYKYIASLANPTWTATGAMGAFRYAIIYNSSAAVKTLLGWWDNSASLTLSSTQTFTVTLDGTNGVLQLS